MSTASFNFIMSSGTLYIIATPIGNLSEMSPRAIETLKSCDIIACEDKRTTANLLNKFEIVKPMFVYEDNREKSASEHLLERLKNGENIALVSDAGTPCISDPGFRLVRACRAESLTVTPIAGPCAFVAALSASGLPSDSFLFAGFLPPKTSARKTFFEKHKDDAQTLIFYESPYRIEKFVDDALEVLGADRIVCIAKEISKFYEKFFVGSLGDVQKSLKQSNTKGEFVAIIAPSDFKL